jgi:thiamine pyrophosphokinase
LEQKKQQLMIFLAGELQDQNAIKQLIQSDSFDFYAADGGYKIAEQLGIQLKLVLGDFDSIDQPKHPNVSVFPCEKDQTDSELALESAISEGYTSIWFIAPFGGRIDHTIANLNLMEYSFKKDVSLKLFDGKNLAFILPTGKHYISNAYRYVSFIPVEENAKISLVDFKYPLKNQTIYRSSSLGISNEPCGKKPEIEIHRGLVYCICIL